MPTGATGNNFNGFKGGKFLRSDVHFLQKHLARILAHTAEQCIAHGARLLINFLEHEVLVAAFFRHNWVPRYMGQLAFHWLAVKVH